MFAKIWKIDWSDWQSNQVAQQKHFCHKSVVIQSQIKLYVYIFMFGKYNWFYISCFDLLQLLKLLNYAFFANSPIQTC